MIMIAQDKKELAALLAAVNSSVTRLNNKDAGNLDKQLNLDSQQILLIRRNLAQIADICKV